MCCPALTLRGRNFFPQTCKRNFTVNDKTPSFVADSGAVSSGGLHCPEIVGCLVKHAAVVAPHVTHAGRFLAWLFG